MELKDFLLGDLCKDKGVQIMLDANNISLKALINISGDVFYVPTDNTRLERLLFDTVERACGRVIKHEITIFQYNEWHGSADASKKREKSVTVNRGGASGLSLELMFNTAIENKASDVYLFIDKDRTRLEMKTFGIKYPVDTFDANQGRRLASLIWSAANNQYDASSPCDASFSFPHENKIYGIRANSVCTSENGNTISCRIRDPKAILDIAGLGYSACQLSAIDSICAAAGGLILFTGATNSGKSTSVTALMGTVPSTAHMIEIADPIEVVMPNCTHIQVDRFHKDHEMLFNRLLASLVRQNPDVLVLGEIRDKRTADATVNMSLQGKRVYSTLHSTTAAGVFSRLNGLGVPDHVLSLPDFIAGVVSQNLVPIPCSHCCLSYTEAIKDKTEFEKKSLVQLQLDKANARFISPQGCSNCFNGVSGQTVVAEVHPYSLDDGAVYEIIIAKEFYRLQAYMRKTHGVLSKVEHAIEKINVGAVDPLATMQIVGGFATAMTDPLQHKQSVNLSISAPSPLHNRSSLPEPKMRYECVT